MKYGDVDGIFVDCKFGKENPGKISTDFFAVRPRAIPPNAFQEESPLKKYTDAEDQARGEGNFRDIVLDGRHRWLPGTDFLPGICRVKGEHSPVSHDHNFVGHCLKQYDPSTFL